LYNVIHERILEFNELTIDFYSFKFYAFIFLLLGLQFINWFFEALKFKLLISVEKEINIITSLKAVYVGNFTAFFTPDRLGTFIGRIIVLKNVEKLKITALTAVGNLGQLIATMVFGLLSLIYITLFEKPFVGLNQTFFKVLLFVFIIILFFLISFYVKPVLVFNRLEKVRYIKNYIIRLSSLKRLKASLKIKVIIFSIMRFLVFYLQYFLIIQFLAVDFNAIYCLIFIGILYGIVTFIPSPFLGNFGSREALALYLTSATTLGILGPFISISVWLINVGVSTLIGGVILTLNKIKSN
jgi:hypothetical protein